MKVTFVSLPAYGHLFPMLPLAQALQSQGADVSVAVGEPQYGQLPLRTIPGSPAGANQMRTAAELAMQRWPQVREDMATRWVPAYFGHANAAVQLPVLRESLAAERPDLVVYEALAPAGALVAADLGVPSICCGLGMALEWARTMLPIARVAADGGFDGESTTTPWEVPADEGALRYLDPMPASLQTAATDGLDRIPLRPVGWTDPTSLAQMPELDPGHGRPRVYVTLGTVMYRAVDVIRQAVDALAGLDVEAVVACGPDGDPSLLGDLPPHVRAYRYLPQAALLPQMDLIVHHGGAGTTLSAAAAGLPQLVMPQGADQFVNAAAIARRGCGRRLSGENQAAERIRDDVEAMLGDCPERRAAADLAGEIAAMPSPDEVAGRLLAEFGAGR